MSEKLLQELNFLSELILQLKEKVDVFYKEFHKSLKKEYHAHQDVTRMKENIKFLMKSRDNIHNKVRAKEEEAAIAKLLLEDHQDEDEEEEFKYSCDPGALKEQCETDLGIEKEIKTEPQEEEIENYLSDADYDPDTAELSHDIKSEKEDEEYNSTGDEDSESDLDWDQPKKSKKTTKTIAKKSPKKKKEKKSKYETRNELVECSICQKMMKRRYLKPHEKLHTQSERNFACPTCNKTFLTKDILRCHKRIHNEKKFVCEICGWGFHLRNNLVNHMRKHSEDKPYVCKEAGCGATFKSHPGFIAHTNKHTNNESLCPKCPKFFSSASTLNRHLKNVHDPNAPRRYKCNICVEPGRLSSFKQLSALKLHMRIHSRSSPSDSSAPDRQEL